MHPTIDDIKARHIALPQIFGNLLLILIGSALCAVAVNGILIPQQFVSSGITGLAIIIHKILPWLNTGYAYILLNLPLFLIAWLEIGRRFFFFSLAGLLSLSGALLLIHIPVPVHDKILSALLAGILTGAGAGITLRSFGSQGGLDILSILLLRRFSISIGNTILCVNSIVLLLVLMIYSLDAVLYSLIVFYVSTKVLNLVVTGLSQRKAVFIISPKADELAREILKDIKHGVTILHGEGGYSKQSERVLYTVITFRYLGHLKQLIRRVDPGAFVVVNDTREVMNYRIGNQPHW